MSSVLYSKRPLTVEQHIDLLLQRGMHMPGRDRARHYLTHINYYRLRAYWMPFEVSPVADQHQFRTGTSFDDILALYDFDRELRLLLLDAIERIEISLRARWASHLALQYGSFAHTDPKNFKQRNVWQDCMNELNKEYRRSRETFADHYRNNYGHLTSPPIWVACELMTLGHISRWLQNLEQPRDRQHIANAYALDERVLVSFTHHLTVVRNHCAHHGRIWNRKFSLKMQLPRMKPKQLSAAFNPAEDRRLYNTLTLLAYLMRIISPASTWETRVRQLLESCRLADTAAMGFPQDWQQREFWRMKT